MSRKDFDAYYNSICKQFYELQDVLTDLSVEVSKGMIAPERIEQLNQTILPVENNYRTLSYIKYLLDKPKKKTKRNRYDNSNKKLLNESKGRMQNDLEEENSKIISTLKL